MGSGEQSVEKVHWMPICLPLSADIWDSQQELDKQFGKWFGSDSSLQYAHLYAFNVLQIRPISSHVVDVCELF